MKYETLQQRAKAIEERKAALGISGSSFVPVNSGRNRTANKRALLSAIGREAKRQGRVAPFAVSA